MLSDYQTRNLLDIKVGKKHCIQIRLHLRPQDLSWFNSNSALYKNELLNDIVSKQILPLECKEDIEKYYSRNKKGLPVGGGKDGDNEIGKGEMNGLKRKNDEEQNDNTNNNKNSNSKVNSKTKKRTASTATNKAKAKKNSKNSSKKSNNNNEHDGGGDQDEDDNPMMFTMLSSKNFKFFNRFLYSNHIKILYKCVSTTTTKANSYSSGRCILSYVNTSSNNDDNEDTSNNQVSKAEVGSTDNISNQVEKQNRHLSNFEALIPIPKLIIIWCYPYDIQNSNELDMMNVGQTFPREEMIPVSKLFYDKEG